VPRSIVGWFIVCWSFFLLAALVVGTLLVSLYRESAAERLRRSSVAVYPLVALGAKSVPNPRRTSRTESTSLTTLSLILAREDQRRSAEFRPDRDFGSEGWGFESLQARYTFFVRAAIRAAKRS
jgi:hypothetical protein